jgi:hypothetical protein
VSLREHRAHVGRVLLIVAGVATGIAPMVAFDVMNASVITGFRQTVLSEWAAKRRASDKRSYVNYALKFLIDPASPRSSSDHRETRAPR